MSTYSLSTDFTIGMTDNSKNGMTCMFEESVQLNRNGSSASQGRPGRNYRRAASQCDTLHNTLTDKLNAKAEDKSEKQKQPKSALRVSPSKRLLATKRRDTEITMDNVVAVSRQARATSVVTGTNVKTIIEEISEKKKTKKSKNQPSIFAAAAEVVPLRTVDEGGGAGVP